MNANERRLALACRHISEAAEGLAGWAGASDRLIPSERVALQDAFYRAAAEARALTASVHQLPALGVVGAARSGKTALIAALITGSSTPATVGIEGSPQRLSLVDLLVPVGGAHEAGVVIRYCNPKRPVRRGFPIELKLLSLVELVEILGQAYLLSAAESTRSVPGAAEVRAAHVAAEPFVAAEPVRGLSEDDALAIRDFFCTHHGHLPVVAALTSTGYWDSLAELGPYLADAPRARLLSLLWGGLAPFDHAYGRLTAVLAGLRHTRDVACNIDALADVEPKSGTVVRRPDTILATSALSRLFDDDGPRVAVYSAHAHVTEISRAALAALVAEVRLSVDTPPGGLLEQADILEYPGLVDVRAPSAFALDDASARSSLVGAFADSKARYLHARDVAATAITSMLVCLDQERPQVGPLAEIVAEWVQRSHGADPSERERHEGGLFVALTRMDLAFVDAAAGDQERRIDWEARIGHPLAEGFGRVSNWPQSWTPDRPFDGVHLIVSPAVKETTLFGPDGVLRPSQRDRVFRAREDYLESSVVGRHVADPAGLWADTFFSGDGGLGRLRRSIADVCQAATKYRRLFADAEALSTAVRNSLLRYCPGDQPGVPFEHRRALALVAARRLRVSAEMGRLNRLFAALAIADADLVDVFRDLEARLGKQTRETPSESEAAWTMMLARAALDSWTGRIRGFARSGRVATTYGVAPATLLSLIEELVIGTNRSGLEAHIAKRIGETGASMTDPEQRLEAAAICAARLMNNYLFHLGFDNPRANRLLRRKDKAETPIFSRSEAEDLASVVADTANPELTIHSDWSQAFMALVDDNVKELRETKVAPEEASRLEQFLRKLELAH